MLVRKVSCWCIFLFSCSISPKHSWELVDPPAFCFLSLFFIHLIMVLLELLACPLLCRFHGVENKCFIFSPTVNSLISWLSKLSTIIWDYRARDHKEANKFSLKEISHILVSDISVSLSFHPFDEVISGGENEFFLCRSGRQCAYHI